MIWLLNLHSQKKKSKKEGSSRRRQAEAADPDSIQVDEPAQSRTSAAELEEQVMMDDEGLQAALSRQRRARSRKNAEAIKRVAEQQPSTSDSPMLVDGNGTSGLEVKQEDDLDEGGLVLDDTSEFVRSLNPTALEEQKPARTTNTNAVPTASAPSPSFAPTTANGTTSTAPIPVELEEGEQPDTEMAPKEELQELDVASKQEEDDAFGGTSREVLVSGGLGATLNLLKQQGLVKGATEDELQRDSQFKNRQAWLAARRQDQMDVLAAQQARRAQGHSNPKGGQNYEQRQREMENKQRERDLANRELDRFKDYKPTVDIKYHDEYGRQMNQKEAWKCV